MTYLSNNRSNLIPGIDDGYVVGSPTNRWKDGYFAHNSLHVVSTSAETTVATDWNFSIINDGYFSVNQVNDGYLTVTRFGNVGIGTTQPNARAQINGSLSLSTTTITDSDVTLDITYYTVRMSTGITTRTVNLPSAATVTGIIYIIKKIDAGIGEVTIDAADAETIDGAATKSISTQYGSFTIQSNGTGWDVIATVGA